MKGSLNAFLAAAMAALCSLPLTSGCAPRLANGDAPAALRRLVNENVAGVERALAVQERDAQQQ